ncbi:MAG: gamma-butyrobetaine dioxygenase [Satyrvirus sp.]|uniref:trimethyllysine dioxygenase n=1 Tax=Satyrvirus sp. TaxID=2487771 RepID=A0A3G5AIF1_9VIRU|nr:MAG: gamma-butyrobetaine dioxygenase [Satyrvirus sp.]
MDLSKSLPFAIFVQHDGLKLVSIQFDDNTNYVYHTMWLRHNCRCEKICLHPKTKEMIICPSSFKIVDIMPSIGTIKDNELYIVWMDGHKSKYGLGWLLEYKHVATDNIAILSMNFNIRPNVSIFSWIEMESDDEMQKQILTIMSCVQKYGYCHIKNFGLDNEKLKRLMATKGYPLFGSHFGDYEKIEPAEYNTFNKHTDQLGYTNDIVDMHTDQTFIENCPPFQALHCMQKAESGGANMIIDAKKVYNMMKEFFPLEAQLLCTQPILFHRKQKDYESKLEKPIIKLDSNGDFKQIRSSYFTLAPFDVPFNMMVPYYTAYNRFHELVRKPESQIIIQLEPGEIIIYDNHRMMHGRMAFIGYRLMIGTYHTEISDLTNH